MMPNHAGTIIAFDVDTGEVLWKLKVGNGPTMGLTFNNDTIYAATRFNATVVAINATDSEIIWQTQPLGDSKLLQYILYQSQTCQLPNFTHYFYNIIFISSIVLELYFSGIEHPK